MRITLVILLLGKRLKIHLLNLIQYSLMVMQNSIYKEMFQNKHILSNWTFAGLKLNMKTLLKRTPTNTAGLYYKEILSKNNKVIDKVFLNSKLICFK